MIVMLQHWMYIRIWLDPLLKVLYKDLMVNVIAYTILLSFFKCVIGKQRFFLSMFVLYLLQSEMHPCMVIPHFPGGGVRRASETSWNYLRYQIYGWPSVFLPSLAHQIGQWNLLCNYLCSTVCVCENLFSTCRITLENYHFLRFHLCIRTNIFGQDIHNDGRQDITWNNWFDHWRRFRYHWKRTVETLMNFFLPFLKVTSMKFICIQFYSYRPQAEYFCFGFLIWKSTMKQFRICWAIRRQASRFTKM